MKDGEVIEILGGLRIEVLISGGWSNNTCCVFVETTPPGAGPPPRKHLREGEIVMALEGRYEADQDGGWTALEIGSPRPSPRSAHHAFCNVGDAPGKIMPMTNGGGIAEYLLAILNKRMPQDLERPTEISAHQGCVSLPRPPG